MGFLGPIEEILDRIQEIEPIIHISSKNRKTAIFPLFIPYNPSLPKLYRNVYGYMRKCMIQTKKGLVVQGCPSDYFEKIEIDWFSSREILEGRKIMRSVFLHLFSTYVLDYFSLPYEDFYE